jgi:hypothetical protein
VQTNVINSYIKLISISVCFIFNSIHTTALKLLLFITVRIESSVNIIIGYGAGCSLVYAG